MGEINKRFTQWIGLEDELTKDEFLIIEKWRLSSQIAIGDFLSVLDIYKNSDESILFFDCFDESSRQRVMTMIDTVGNDVDFDSLEKLYPGYDAYGISCYNVMNDKLDSIDWLSVVLEEHLHPGLERIWKLIQDRKASFDMEDNY